MRIRSGRFETLDAMRGVAALVVALFHFRRTLPWSIRDYCPQSGYLAVDLFFVLSGFVIALSYDRKLGAGLTLGQFVETRVVRLLPMIWVGVAIGGIYLVTLGRYSPTAIAAIVACNAFLLPYLGRGGSDTFAADTSAWSLFFEWVANLFYALAWRWLSVPVLIGIIVTSGAGLAWAAAAHGNLNTGWSLPTVSAGFARVGFSFFLGVLLWRTRERWAALVPRLPAAVVLAVVALCLWPLFTGTARAVFDLGFVLLLSPALVMLGAATEPSGRGVGAAEWLATISYPLYAIHKPVQLLTEQLASRAGVSTRLAASVACVLIVPASWWLAKRYDEPVRAFLRRRPAVGAA